MIGSSGKPRLVCIVNRPVISRQYRYIYPPKIRPGKFLWSKNNVLNGYWLYYIHYYTSPKKFNNKFWKFISPKNFWLRPWTITTCPATRGINTLRTSGSPSRFLHPLYLPPAPLPISSRLFSQVRGWGSAVSSPAGLGGAALPRPAEDSLQRSQVEPRHQKHFGTFWGESKAFHGTDVLCCLTDRTVRYL